MTAADGVPLHSEIHRDPRSQMWRSLSSWAIPTRVLEIDFVTENTSCAVCGPLPLSTTRRDLAVADDDEAVRLPGLRLRGDPVELRGVEADARGRDPLQAPGSTRRVAQADRSASAARSDAPRNRRQLAGEGDWASSARLLRDRHPCGSVAATLIAMLVTRSGPRRASGQAPRRRPTRAAGLGAAGRRVRDAEGGRDPQSQRSCSRARGRQRHAQALRERRDGGRVRRICYDDRDLVDAGPGDHGGVAHALADSPRDHDPSASQP